MMKMKMKMITLKLNLRDKSLFKLEGEGVVEKGKLMQKNSRPCSVGHSFFQVPPYISEINVGTPCKI
jgi:hypothetical protein